MRFFTYFTTLLMAALFFCAFSSIQAQQLPEQIRISADGRRLVTGIGESKEGLYDSATVHSIYLTFPQTNYWTLLTQNYASKTDLMATMTVNGEVYDSVGVRFRGQTSYQMAGNSQKKSFDITTDGIKEDQKLLGYKNLNLLNAFQDASFLREVFFRHQIRKHIPAVKTNFVQLYINDQPWGLYPNVEQLNKDFYEEWFLSNDGANWRADAPAGTGGGGGGPSWGDGKAALNWLGADTSLYKQYYTLKTSDTEEPWQYLVNTCNALNNTTLANLPSVLPQYMDIDRTLWFLASEVAFSDDDSYIFKGKMDYYLYYEPETGRITPIEYDGNSVMASNGTTWSPFYNETKVNYPLMNKLLKVPEYRQRYLAHLRTIISEELDPTSTAAILENYRTQISPLVQADPKKLYTFAAFNTEVTKLKDWVVSRRNYLLSNAEVSQVAPTISAVTLLDKNDTPWAAPKAGEEAWVTVQASAAAGISAVNLYYATGIVGNFTKIAMVDDGAHHDGTAGDGIFGAAIPAYSVSQYVRFYTEAVSANTTKSVVFAPAGAEHDVYFYRVLPSGTTSTAVSINEFMASNATTVTDQDGEYEDWIELFNTSAVAVDLTGHFLSDNPNNPGKWKFPAGTTLPASGYLIVWADENGSQQGIHTNFKLSANGESIVFSGPDTVILSQIDFGAQTTDVSAARIPNGTGAFVFQPATFGFNNETVSTEDLHGKTLFLSIAPNPSTGLVTVTSSLEAAQALEVFDVFGKKVVETSLYQTKQLDLNHLPSGLYFIKSGNAVRKCVLVNE